MKILYLQLPPSRLLCAMTGSGQADCTLRNTQAFEITPGEFYRYQLNDSGSYTEVVADENGLNTVPKLSGGDLLTVIR